MQGQYASRKDANQINSSFLAKNPDTLIEMEPSVSHSQNPRENVIDAVKSDVSMIEQSTISDDSTSEDEDDDKDDGNESRNSEVDRNLANIIYELRENSESSGDDELSEPAGDSETDDEDVLELSNHYARIQRQKRLWIYISVSLYSIVLFIFLFLFLGYLGVLLPNSQNASQWRTSFGLLLWQGWLFAFVAWASAVIVAGLLAFVFLLMDSSPLTALKQMISKLFKKTPIQSNYRSRIIQRLHARAHHRCSPRISLIYSYMRPTHVWLWSSLWSLAILIEWYAMVVQPSTNWMSTNLPSTASFPLWWVTAIFGTFFAASLGFLLKGLLMHKFAFGYQRGAYLQRVQDALLAEHILRQLVHYIKHVESHREAKKDRKARLKALLIDAAKQGLSVSEQEMLRDEKIRKDKEEDAAEWASLASASTDSGFLSLILADDEYDGIQENSENNNDAAAQTRQTAESVNNNPRRSTQQEGEGAENSGEINSKEKKMRNKSINREESQEQSTTGDVDKIGDKNNSTASMAQKSAIPGDMNSNEEEENSANSSDNPSGTSRVSTEMEANDLKSQKAVYFSNQDIYGTSHRTESTAMPNDVKSWKKSWDVQKQLHRALWHTVTRERLSPYRFVQILDFVRRDKRSMEREEKRRIRREKEEIQRAKLEEQELRKELCRTHVNAEDANGTDYQTDKVGKSNLLRSSKRRFVATFKLKSRAKRSSRSPVVSAFSGHLAELLQNEKQVKKFCLRAYNALKARRETHSELSKKEDIPKSKNAKGVTAEGIMRCLTRWYPCCHSDKFCGDRLLSSEEQKETEAFGFAPWLSPQDRKLLRAITRKTMLLFDSDRDGVITMNELVGSVMNCIRERKWLRESLFDARSVVHKLDAVFTTILIIILVLICLAVFGVNVQALLLSLSAVLVAYAFLFGPAMANLFQCAIFIFMVHPFDVGDVCIIDNLTLTVHRVNFLTTTFLQSDGQRIYYPNIVLNSKAIYNLRRSEPMYDTLLFQIDSNTSGGKIDALIKRMRDVPLNHPNLFDPHHFDIFPSSIENTTKIEFTIWSRGYENWQNGSNRVRRRNMLLYALKSAIDDLEITFYLPIQPVFMMSNSSMENNH